ncbi:MAG TPA: hypothetical protein VGZ73_30225 [Bryobacteraceae bacterium]|nr:hypothetical protein [Bryobacteraceae bacterium]
MQPTRRQPREQAGFLLTASQLHGGPVADSTGAYGWIRSTPIRTVRAVSRLRSEDKLAAGPRDRWLDFTVPSVLIHDALRVDLA